MELKLTSEELLLIGVKILLIRLANSQSISFGMYTYLYSFLLYL